MLVCRNGTWGRTGGRARARAGARARAHGLVRARVSQKAKRKVQRNLAANGDDAACRSDPTFTRASPGLAVAEQLPQISFTIIIITEDIKGKRGHKTHVNFARSTSARTQADGHQLPSPWSSALPLANTAVQLSPAKSS